MSKKSPRAIVPQEQIDELNQEPAPAGSLEPIGPKSGWAHSLNAAALSSLRSIEDSLASEVTDAIKSNIRHKMKIGKLLNEARVLFPGDNEFGKWRQEFAKEHLPGAAPRTLNSYMQMSNQYKNSTEFVESIGWTTARELINAAPVIMKKVEQLVEIDDIAGAKEAARHGSADSPPPDSDISPVHGTATGDTSNGGVPIDVPGPSSGPSVDTGSARRTGKVVSIDSLLADARQIDDPAKRWGFLDELSCDDLMKAYALFGLLMPESDESYPGWVIATLHNELLGMVEEQDAVVLNVIHQAHDLILGDV